MKLVSDLYNKVAAFKQNEKGSIIPLTAIMLTTLGLAAGAAVDYSRYSKAKTIMDTALDAAILDAGVRLGQGEPVNQAFEDRFNEFFNVNITGRGGFSDNFEIVSFSADAATGKVTASAAADVDTTLMRIGGFDTMQVASTSGGVFEQNETEVTIMLDVTGSMRGSKIRALRDAASQAVDILLPQGVNTRNTRVGIVPYASSVNADQYAARATMNNASVQIASTDAFANSSFNVPTNECVTGRGGRDVATDTSYQTAPVGSDKRSIQNDRAFFRCPDSKIMPLTNDAGALKSEINGMAANGYTAGHLGIAWSYYMLSPKWNTLWQNPAHEAVAYSSDVNKVAILMTDGIFNTAYDAVGDGDNDPFDSNASKTRSQDVSTQLCDNMKGSGITLYSIAFKAPASAQQTLRYCANTDTSVTTFYYSADNEDQLKEAFEKIAKDITSLRLTQ